MYVCMCVWKADGVCEGNLFQAIMFVGPSKFFKSKLSEEVEVETKALNKGNASCG
jgi:hypothetical protein